MSGRSGGARGRIASSVQKSINTRCTRQTAHTYLSAGALVGPIVLSELWLLFRDDPWRLKLRGVSLQ